VMRPVWLAGDAIRNISFELVLVGAWPVPKTGFHFGDQSLQTAVNLTGTLPLVALE